MASENEVDCTLMTFDTAEDALRSYFRQGFTYSVIVNLLSEYHGEKAVMAVKQQQYLLITAIAIVGKLLLA